MKKRILGDTIIEGEKYKAVYLLSTAKNNQGETPMKRKSIIRSELYASEILYRRLFEAAKDGFLILDAESGKIIDINPFLTELLGYSKNEIIDKTIWEIGSFKNIYKNKEKFLELQEEENVQYDELPLLTSAGRKIYVVSNAYLVGNKKIIQCSIHNITTRTETEAALKKTGEELAEVKKSADEINEFNENIINTIREPLFLIDKDLRVIKASRSFYHFFKVTAEETVGKLIYELGNHQWDIPKLKELLEKIIPEKNNFDNYEVEHNFSTIGKRVMLLNARQVKRAFGKEQIILLAIEDITERKRKEDSLQETHRATSEFLNILLNLMHAPIIIWDTSLTIIRFNHQFELMSGYDSADLIGKKIDFLFPKEKIGATLELLKNNLDAEHLEVTEIDILTKDNNTKTVLWNSSRILDEEGKNIIATISQDITSRRQSEIALRKSEFQLRTLVKTIPDLIWLKDTNGVYLSCNQMFERFFGAKETDIIGKTDYDFVDSELSDFFRENDRKAMEAGKPTSNEEWVTFADDGHRAFLDTIKTPIYDSDKTLLGVLGIGRDLTERKLAGKVLQASEKRFRAIFDQAPIAIALLDLEGHPIVSNVRLSNMLGYTKDELSEMTFSEFTYPEDIDKDLNQFADLIAGKISGYNMEKRYIHKYGNLIWANLYVTTLNDDNGLPQEIIGMVEDITEQKQAEQQIIAVKEQTEESEKKYKDLINSSQNLIWTCDLQGRFTFLNKAWEETHGYSISEMLGKPFSDFQRPEIFQRDFIEFSRHIAGGFIKGYETSHIRKDGTEIPLLFNAMPLSDLKGEVIGTQGTAFDISKLKETEKELIAAKEKAEESEEKYKLLHDYAGVGIGYYNAEGKVISFNQLAAKNMNGNPEDFIGKSIFDFSPKSEADLYINRIQKAIIATEPAVYEDLVQLPNDEKWFLSAFTKIAKSHNKVYGVQIISQDITKLKTTEIELQKAKEKAEESEQRFRSLIENAPDGVVILNESGKFIYVSPNSARLFGYNVNEVIGHLGDEFTHPDDLPLVLKTIETIFNNPLQKPILNYRFRRKNGEYRWIETTFTNLLSDKSINGIILNFTDVTERRQILEDLVTAKENAEESDRLKSAFLANMSHEIRTPMNGILGFTELLLEPDLSSEQKEAYINIVNQSGQRMLNTVNDIVEISKIEAGIVTVDLKKVDVQKRLNELMRFFIPEATKKGLKLTLENEVPKARAVILTDQNKLDSIFTNLMKNAIKYTKAGEIRVGCKTVKTQGLASLQFYVKDTGIGIPAERQQAVFERFIKADILDKDARQGSGLGLSITKAYVEMLGGEIRVESKINRGSTFFFTLPLNEHIQEEKRDLNQEEKTSQIKGLNIVIAEDDETSALYLQTILQTESNKIILTKNGYETVETCRNNPDIDLVLMDIQMPDLNGYEATRQIRQFDKNVIIIAQTAFGLFGDREKAIDAGCNDYIAKPIKKEELRNLINTYFGY